MNERLPRFARGVREYYYLYATPAAGALRCGSLCTVISIINTCLWSHAPRSPVFVSGAPVYFGRNSQRAPVTQHACVRACVRVSVNYVRCEDSGGKECPVRAECADYVAFKLQRSYRLDWNRCECACMGGRVVNTFPPNINFEQSRRDKPVV